MTVLKMAKNKKKIKIFKWANVITGIDVRKQHDQSQVTALPLYRLSQSGMRIIHLLK